MFYPHHKKTRWPAYLRFLTFIDPTGNAIATSIGNSVIGAKGKLFIGEPLIGKISKKKLFFLSHRVESAKGEFLGVVAAPMSVDSYVQVFENSRFNSDISISLIHAGGKVIARVPNFEKAFARDMRATPLFENVQKASSGKYKTVNIIDNLSLMPLS